MAFDYTRLRLGERIAGVCALLLFIDEFLDWYSLNIPGGPGVSAWDIFGWVDLLMLLSVIVVLTWVALTGMQRSVALPVTMTTIAAALCAFTTLIVLYRIVNQPGPNAIVNVEYGAYFGLLLLVAMTYGAYRAMRDEGSTFGEAGSKLRAAVESRTEPTPPRTTPAPPPPPAPPAQAPPPPADPPPPATG